VPLQLLETGPGHWVEATEMPPLRRVREASLAGEGG